ncbi:MAG: hypothetical protein U9Q39_06245 [Pseudomonadota bacterium]|nr:hypothetical protein [Pseudomonadota bacterium]
MLFQDLTPLFTKTFTRAYPDATTSVISQENFSSFLLDNAE